MKTPPRLLPWEGPRVSRGLPLFLWGVGRAAATKRILIVGGGTIGWLTAGYLARRLGADLPGGAVIQLIENGDVDGLGVGEGTLPTIRRTLDIIGIDEAEMVRRCGATLKQGTKFVGWAQPPGSPGRDHYFHAFQAADTSTGLELLPYWLLEVAGEQGWDEVGTWQKAIADACRAPKLPTHPSFVGSLNYAFHFDPVALAGLLREQAVANGVGHIVDTVREVLLTPDGSIACVRTTEHDLLEADLYIDCTGFRAELIGEALAVPFRSCSDTLFCDRAIAIEMPHPGPNDPIASCTISTAQEAGWIWDIGLDRRRDAGHVYSSGHTDDDGAEELLRSYLGPAADRVETRRFRFDAGFRKINWYKNCVAIGPSSGFFEPLEATGIAFSELAAGLLASLFPWSGDYETSARQFNSVMLQHYERTLDFIKLHYCISKRRDTTFWCDNVAPASVPDSLRERLERWRYRYPTELDVDANLDVFNESSWQYVLYGMGWKTDLGLKAGIYRYSNDARAAFAEVRRQAQFAMTSLPTNRQLVEYARARNFGVDGATAA